MTELETSYVKGRYCAHVCTRTHMQSNAARANQTRQSTPFCQSLFVGRNSSVYKIPRIGRDHFYLGLASTVYCHPPQRHLAAA